MQLSYIVMPLYTSDEEGSFHSSREYDLSVCAAAMCLTLCSLAWDTWKIYMMCCLPRLVHLSLRKCIYMCMCMHIYVWSSLFIRGLSLSTKSTGICIVYCFKAVLHTSDWCLQPSCRYCVSRTRTISNVTQTCGLLHLKNLLAVASVGVSFSALTHYPHLFHITYLLFIASLGEW